MSYDVLQISAGQGPLECRKFTALLGEIIRKESQQNGILLQQLSEFPEFTGSLRFISAEPIPEDFKRRWSGTVQWIWKSTIRPHHQRKNWFVKVSFFRSETDERSVFKKEDLKIETFRSSGAGGQHINRTDSAVRITHLPTGIHAIAADERSQIRNKALALLRLQEQLQSRSESAKRCETSALRMEHYRLERGNPVRVFSGLPLKEKF